MGWVSTERNHDEQPITVGVIDDDPMICQMMRLILEDYSSGRISVAFACTNAADAIEHASHNPPDVVLADIAMPGMDGIEARGRGLHQCGNQRENVHFRTHGQSAYFIRRR